MDYKIIGLFIANQRKLKNLTQAKLAEKLYVSEKTISKWENGKGLPDTSLLTDLCEILEVTVNELLSGEKLSEKNYRVKAEENITDLLAERKTNKQKIAFSIICLLVCLSMTYICVFLSIYLDMANWLKICLIVYGVIVLILGGAVMTYYDVNVGSFECGKCGKHFTPKTTAYLLGMHGLTKRFLKCPHCSKYSFCKKKLTK